MTGQTASAAREVALFVLSVLAATVVGVVATVFIAMALRIL